MKRLLLAGSLVLPFALARAQQGDAYGSLVGMADSASSDHGPQAGEIGSDLAGERLGSEPPEAAKTDSEAPAGERSEVSAAVAAPAPAPKRERVKPKREDDEPAVSVPAAAAPRVWTKLFSSLLPNMARGSAFEVAASTVSRSARPEPARPATAASAAGSAQGMLELVAAATAPSSPDR
jgi:hypothetical protein